MDFMSMKMINKSILISFVFACMMFSFVSADTWKEIACDVHDLEQEWCKHISNNYSWPYCVTSFSARDNEVSDVDYAKSCIWPALTNRLSSIKDREISIDEFSMRDVIELYCLSLYWNSDTWRIYFAKPSGQTDSWDWQQTFDSHQSLFLYGLCSSFKDKDWNTPFVTWDSLSGVYKWDLVQLLKLQQISDRKDLCSLENDSSLADCDMSIYATKIYEGMMSDLYKIAYAQVLNLNSIENFEAEQMEKVEKFMSWYFLIHESYPVLKGEFPKAISTLESNQKYYKKVLASLKIIDNSMLASLSIKSKCPVKWNMTWLNFVACALHASQWHWPALTLPFLTLIYNEILHYRQFVTFYQNWLSLKIEAMWMNSTQEKNVRIYQSRLSDFKKYFDMQIDATKWAQREFEEFSMTYPIHIWMLLNIERTEKFRNFGLSPEITLFYSLSEKLKNVQLPS